MPNGAEIARSTIQEVRKVVPQALWCWPTATQLRPTRFWFLAIAANMSTIYSMDGAPGKSWKVNRDSIGLKLWVPQKGSK